MPYKYIFSLILVAHSVYSSAQNTRVDTLKYCLQASHIGVGGFDVVSYFNEKAPLIGKSGFSFKHDGVEYLFANEVNKNKFKADPIKYLPQFGGWCSMTLAMGRATTPKYDNFYIQDGKLWLFERTLSVNGQELWLRDPKANEKVANKNYTSYKRKGKIE
jgi:YHS domain-containing protein